MYDIDRRRHRSEEEAADFTECSNCGCHLEKSAAFPCSGSDTCTARFCEGCVSACESCGLPTCASCKGENGWCLICCKEEEFEVADQADCRRAQELAMSGAKLSEIRAAMEQAAS